MHGNRPKKVKRVRFSQNLQKAPKTPIARPSITPILRMDQVSSIYNPGNDFFWREEGPCRARARTSPARPSLGVPPTRCGGFPVTALGQTRLNLQVNSSLGQPAWFAPIGWTGTSRSQVGVPPRMSSFVSRQIQSKKQIRLGFFECSCHIGFLDNGVELRAYWDLVIACNG